MFAPAPGTSRAQRRVAAASRLLTLALTVVAFTNAIATITAFVGSTAAGRRAGSARDVSLGPLRRQRILEDMRKEAYQMKSMGVEELHQVITDAREDKMWQRFNKRLRTGVDSRKRRRAKYLLNNAKSILTQRTIEEESKMSAEKEVEPEPMMRDQLSDEDLKNARENFAMPPGKTNTDVGRKGAMLGGPKKISHRQRNAMEKYPEFTYPKLHYWARDGDKRHDMEASAADKIDPQPGK